jgi:hypothetical protein
MVYLPNFVLFSHKESNEIMLFVHKWMDLEIIMFSKIRQARRTKITCFSSSVEARPIKYI